MLAAPVFILNPKLVATEANPPALVNISTFFCNLRTKVKSLNALPNCPTS